MTNFKSVPNSDEVTQNKYLTKEKRESVTARMDLTHAKRFMLHVFMLFSYIIAYL